MNADKLDHLKEAIIALNGDEAVKLTNEAIEAGVQPLEIIENGLRPSLEKLGKDFEVGNIFLPELVAAGKIATQVGDIVEAEMVGGADSISRGTIALGSVKGDIHSIGKNIVGVLMKAAGFKVIDLGVDVEPEEFLEIIQDVEVVALSGLLTTATRSMREIIEKVKENHPDKIVITGGAAMNPELASALGVLYGSDASGGVRLLNEALG